MGNPDNSKALNGARRFFVQPGSISGSQIIICGPQARQICTVLRLEVGDAISVLDGSGCCHIARIDEVTRRQVTAEITGVVQLDTEPRVKLTLAQALAKGDKVELVVQKATELGISRMVVFTSQRTVPKPDAAHTARKMERWRAIAREAAEQSGRALVPEVHGVVGFRDLLAGRSDDDLTLIAWEAERETPLSKILAGANAERITLIVGPEGGFTEQEVAIARDAGAAPVSFGKRILRSETAAIAGCAIIMHYAEEAKGSSEGIAAPAPETDDRGQA
jgi:16S rRNA (uracil1498-N3)-methyltransferase